MKYIQENHKGGKIENARVLSKSGTLPLLLPPCYLTLQTSQYGLNLDRCLHQKIFGLRPSHGQLITAFAPF